MNIKDFLLDLPRLTLSDDGDSQYSAIRVLTKGMAGIRTAKVINRAAYYLDPDECYFEIGTYTGFTLISSSMGNARLCIGADDFSMKDIFKPDVIEQSREQVRKILKNNLMMGGAVQFFETDFRKLISPNNQKIGVFFIDGEHTYQDVKDALMWAEAYLADKSVIIFDDVNMPGVKQAIWEWQSSNPNRKIVFHIECPQSEWGLKSNNGMASDTYFSNGITICTYEKI